MISVFSIIQMIGDIQNFILFYFKKEMILDTIIFI